MRHRALLLKELQAELRLVRYQLDQLKQQNQKEMSQVEQIRKLRSLNKKSQLFDW